MNEDHHPNKELEQLLFDLLDGEWNVARKERLESLLRDDAAARTRYRELMAMHAMLSSEFGGSLNLKGDDIAATNQCDLPSVARPGDGESPPNNPGPVNMRSNRWFSSLGWIAAAVVVAAVAVWALFLKEERRDDRPVSGTNPRDTSFPEHAGDSEEPVIAVVTRAIRAQWEDGAEPLRSGQSVGKRWLKLRAGIVQIKFQSGVRVTLEGPGQLRVDSVADCFVRAGKLTVLAPPDAANFTVKSPAVDVIDLGTEFGLVVEESGKLDIHVLDGEVEIALKGIEERPATRQKLVEKQAASVPAEQKQIKDVPFDQEVFEPIRVKTLWRAQPLKIQFDCGNRAGVYHGSQSPAHAAGDMHLHETYWNVLVGDQTGVFVLADGSVSPRRIEVDLGHGRKSVDWEAEVDTVTGPQGHTRGIFNTALGRDAINPPSKPYSDLMGLRLRGLPKGRYRVYVLGRLSLDHRNWGNYLVEKAHVAAVGLNLTDLTPPVLAMAPLDDPDAECWVDGQTHVVTEIEVSDPDQYLTIITSKDKERSPSPAGGRAVILGAQILQLAE